MKSLCSRCTQKCKQCRCYVVFCPDYREDHESRTKTKGDEQSSGEHIDCFSSNHSL